MTSSTSTRRTSGRAAVADRRRNATRTAFFMPYRLPLREVLRLRLVIEELGDVVAEDELEVADGAVALLGDDDLGDALLFRVLVVDLVAVDEAHQVGVLLDRAGFTQIGELRAVVAGALFRAA